MKVVRQARLELSGGSTPDQLRPGSSIPLVQTPDLLRFWIQPPSPPLMPLITVAQIQILAPM